MKDAGIPIERAQMRLSITVPKDNFSAVLTIITPLATEIESTAVKSKTQNIAIVRIDPGKFRSLYEALTQQPGVLGFSFLYSSFSSAL